MKKIKLGLKIVEVYDSIDELPIKRFHKFNKYMLVDAGIGSDLNDINEHIVKIGKFIDADPKNAKIELENLRQSLYLVSESTNIKHLSFMILIHSINGNLVTDYSDNNLKLLSKELENTEKGILDRLIESVKKKIDSELTLYFPNTFNDISLKEYYDKLRSKTLLQLDSIIRGKDNEKAIDKIDSFLLTLAKPLIFTGSQSVEIKFDKQFNEMCLVLNKEMSVNIDSMSVLDFYNAFEFIKKDK